VDYWVNLSTDVFMVHDLEVLVEICKRAARIVNLADEKAGPVVQTGDDDGDL
jgi:hypothetical protein